MNNKKILEEAIQKDDGLSPIIKRIYKAVKYSGSDDHEDVRSIIKKALQQKDQALIDTFLKMKGNNKWVDDVIDSVIKIIKEQQWET